MRYFNNSFLCGFFCFITIGLTACGKDDDSQGNNDVPYFEGEPVPVDPSCASLRITSYDAGDGGWCEFSASQAVLPEFVRNGMHLAIAEPWNGSSFGGEPGEACGECWQVDTLGATQILMVNNLCPIEGNPLCSGGHFHFDLSQQAATALGSHFGEATAKRVPCPVEGNIHIQVNDSNEWGYLRLAFINHLIPVRSFEISVSLDGPWVPAERSGGAWHVREGPRPDEGDGLYFQITSAAGETVTSAMTVPFQPQNGSAHNLGVQFTQTYEEPQTCEFTPPGDVFMDAWGGIEGVKWQPNPWGDNIKITEVSDGCFDNTAACLSVIGMKQWEGAHLYYSSAAFPVDTFTSLTLQAKAASGNGQLIITPSGELGRCAETTYELTTDWTEITIDLATACAGHETIHTVTLNNVGEPFDFLLDEILFNLFK